MIVKLMDYSLLPTEGILDVWGEALHPVQRAELERMHNPHAILQSAAAGMLLRESVLESGVLGAMTPSGEWNNLEWKVRPGGKPELPQVSPMGFNLSHSGRLSACAWGEGEIGLDIQLISHVRESVVRRFFCDAERELLGKAEDRERRFHVIWSRREAVVKFIGTGLSQDISRIRWESRRQDREDGFELVDDVYLDGEWICTSRSVVWSYRREGVPEEWYAITVCSTVPWDGKVQYRSLEDIL